jgi:hypothetical protein
LRADWSEIPLSDFEEWVLLDVQGGSGLELTSTDLDGLSGALGSFDLVALRAAILLGASRDPRASQALLERLEQRDLTPLRHADAADVVAAAALARADLAPEQLEELEALAHGPSPHPDLEVRVECAASSIRSGRDAPAVFLLQVLRVGTRAGRSDAIDFEPSPTMAWAKSRAAEALSERAGVPCTFHPDASFEAQEREAEALRLLLERAGALARPGASAERIKG